MTMQDAHRDLHEKARLLIDREQIEGLAPAERSWLAAHLATCEACGRWAESTESALRALKSVSVKVPTGLAASTRLRVREKAAEHRRRRARILALIAGCAGSWIVGVASAPLVWRLCEWLGTTLELPRIVWQLGFLSWWLVPAAAAALVMLLVHKKALQEEFNGRLGSEPRSNRR